MADARSTINPFGGAFLLAALIAACASDPPPPAAQPPTSCPPGQQFDGQYCRTIEPAPTGAGGGAAPAGTTGATLPGAGGSGMVHETSPGPDAVRLDASAASGATALLSPLVADRVPEGAKPVGALVAGQFAVGQSLRESVPMKPGACYTVVGVGLAPVTELDLAFTPSVSVPGFNPTAAKDPETGPNATLGKKPSCFKWALPTAGSMLLTVTVSAGQGVAAAQVYEKL